ncbi:hypothetical protein FMEAI12_3940047 [Parafrankia sp. Ea1.12]|nr:hypothetical protein FMEAI12_3940047 [Parafrankia sp. Ea1.12]
MAGAVMGLGVDRGIVTPVRGRGIARSLFTGRRSHVNFGHYTPRAGELYPASAFPRRIGGGDRWRWPRWAVPRETGPP